VPSASGSWCWQGRAPAASEPEPAEVDGVNSRGPASASRPVAGGGLDSALPLSPFASGAEAAGAAGAPGVATEAAPVGAGDAEAAAANEGTGAAGEATDAEPGRGTGEAAEGEALQVTEAAAASVACPHQSQGSQQSEEASWSKTSWVVSSACLWRQGAPAAWALRASFAEESGAPALGELGNAGSPGETLRGTRAGRGDREGQACGRSASDGRPCAVSAAAPLPTRPRLDSEAAAALPALVSIATAVSLHELDSAGAALPQPQGAARTASSVSPRPEE